MNDDLLAKAPAFAELQLTESKTIANGNRMLSLQKANEARKEHGMEVLNPKEKFERNQTRKTSIDAKCFECNGEDYDHGWKWSIGNCVCKDCSLYPFRPYQSFYGKPMPKCK